LFRASPGKKYSDTYLKTKSVTQEAKAEAVRTQIIAGKGSGKKKKISAW
jgi:hypothetical protein